MPLLTRSRPVLATFIAPCLPSTAAKPPAGPDWLHEIKHDGYRLMAWREGARVRLFTRNGYDWTDRYPAIVAAVGALKVKSCLIDGEMVVCDDAGLSSFARLRSRQHDQTAILYAFDLLTIDGADLRREPLETRKATLASVLRKPPRGIVLCEHMEADGELVFLHACKMGLEGIVSKRRGSRYSSGLSSNWIKSKNPDSAAKLREATEDWG
jgi:bifunctional non-homologous end joining protein LigD